MDADDTPTVRIGHQERDEALEALEVHRQAGRLDGQEYEERTLAVGRARTWGDVGAIFGDLPEPRPVRPPPSHSAGPHPVPAVSPPPGAPPADGEGWGGWQGRYGRLVPVVFGLTPFIALALFFATKDWEWFLLVPAGGVIARGLAGDHAGHDKGKGHHPHAD